MQLAEGFSQQATVLEVESLLAPQMSEAHCEAEVQALWSGAPQVFPALQVRPAQQPTVAHESPASETQHWLSAQLPPLPQELPQWPQLLPSVAVFVQVVPQSVSPDEQTHAPPLQMAPPVQATPP